MFQDENEVVVGEDVATETVVVEGEESTDPEAEIPATTEVAAE